MDIFDVVLSKQVEQSLKKLPPNITIKLQSWVDGIMISGLREMRKIPGYHDEPLHGKRQGQRSIRLNKGYRAIYIIDESGTIHFVEIIEVNKHEY